MVTSSARTSTTVCARRRGVTSGIATVPSPLAEFSGDTPGTLPAREALQALQGLVDAAYKRLGEWLATPDDGDEQSTGEKIGDVVLAEINEGEAERPRVAPAEPALHLGGFGQGERGDQRRGER